MSTGSGARIGAGSRVARAELLLVGVPLERELDQAIEQRRVREPVASHSFGYMLIVVKPGIVLISFT